MKGVLEQEYTVWAAFLGSTSSRSPRTAQSGHGAADADGEESAAERGGDDPLWLADIPIVMCVHDRHPALRLLPDRRGPAVAGPRTRPSLFVLTQMPAGLRGLVVAGVLAQRWDR
jgi:hypothetical protein